MKRGRVRTAGSGYSTWQFENNKKSVGRGESRLLTVLEEIRVTFDCKSAAFFLLNENELVRTTASGPEGPVLDEMIVKLDSEHQLADIIASGHDSTEGGVAAFALKLRDGRKGVLVLERPAKELEALSLMTPILKDAVTMAAESKEGISGLDPAMIFDTIRNLTSTRSASVRLTDITDSLRNICRLRSLRLYSGSGSKIECKFSSGAEMDIGGRIDIQNAIVTGMPSVKIKLDKPSGLLLNRVIIPIEHTGGARMAAVYDIESERRDADEVRTMVLTSYGMALGLVEGERTVSFNWLKAIEFMENEAGEISKLKDPSSVLILNSVLEKLHHGQLIGGYEVEQLDDSVEFRDGVRGRALHSDGNGSVEPSFNSHDGKGVSFNLHDDGGDAWRVTLILKEKPLLNSEREMWKYLALCFGILIKAFISRAKSRKLNFEIGRLKAGATGFINATRSIEAADSTLKLVTSCAEGIATLFQFESFGFIREDGSFRLVSPKNIDLVVNYEDILSLLSSSRMVADRVYDVPMGANSGRLADLTGSETNERLYALALSTPDSEIGSIILCPAQKNYYLSETREVTLSGLASLASIKLKGLKWAEEAQSEKRKLRKVEEVISGISEADGNSKIVSSIVEAACELTKSEKGAIGIIDVETNTIVAGNMGAYEPEDRFEEWSSSSGVTGRILRTQEAEIVNDYLSDPDRQEHAAKDLGFKRIAGVPIRIDVKRRGVLMIAKTTGTPYQSADLRTLEMLSNMASSAFRAINARTDRRRLISDFDTLQSAELKLYSSKTFGELIGLLADEVRKLFHASTVLIASDVNNTKRILFSTTPEIEEGDIIYNSGAIGLQFDELPHSARIMERAMIEEEWGKKMETNELLLVRAGERQNAVVIAAVNKKGASKYGTDDIDNFNKIAKIASTALDKTIVLSGVNQKLKHLEMMHTIVDALVYRKSENEIFDSILPTLVGMCGADVGLLWKYDADRQKVTVSAEFYAEHEPEHLVGYEVSAQRGIVGTVVTNRLPVLIANAAIDNKAVQISGTNVERFESVLGVPLVVREKLLGVLMVYRDNPPPFTSAEMTVLTNLSNDISLVMAKHSLEIEKSSPAETSLSE